MAAELQDYAKIRGFINNQPILQLKSYKWAADGGVIEVTLMNEGLGGFSFGPGNTKIDIGIAVPISGPEFDYAGMMARHEYVDMQVWIGAMTWSGRGQITTVEISQSDGQPTEGSVSWTGPLKEPEV